MAKQNGTGNGSPIKEKRRIAHQLSEEQGVEYEVHHRHPRSRRRSYDGQNINEERNLTILPRTQHLAWHTLVKNELPKEFVKRLNEEFMPPGWYLVAVPRHKPPKKKRRSRRYCVDCECEVLRHITKTSKI